MAFGIIRVRNLKKSDLGSTDLHNARLYNSEEEYPVNINPKGQFSAQYLSEKNGYDYTENVNLKDVVNEKLNGITGLRKDSNVAIEYVVAVSDKKVWDNYHFDGFANRMMDWMNKKHGENSVVAKYVHRDETNPHVHFIVVPTIEKKVNWKNRNGEGTRIEKRLDTKKYTGGRKILRGLQDDYFKELKDNWEKKLGVPFYRGTLKENQTKEYIEKTSVEILRLKEKLSSQMTLLQKKTLELQILQKEVLLSQKEVENQKLIESKRSNSEKWKKKGVNGLSNPFHKKKGPKL